MDPLAAGVDGPEDLASRRVEAASIEESGDTLQVESAPDVDDPRHDPDACTLVAEGPDPMRLFGVIHLRGALTEQEQHTLFLQIKDCWGKQSGAGAYKSFHISSGKAGPHRREPLHELGDTLYARVAAELAQLTEAELAQPVIKRMAQAYSGESAVKTDHVSGVNYQPGGVMLNHTDCDKPLYTMSLALGETCDFTVGKRTKTPRRNEISGEPVTLRMESGDVIFFDGGSVPHAVDRIHIGTAPRFWQKAKEAQKSGNARVSILFRTGL